MKKIIIACLFCATYLSVYNVSADVNTSSNTVIQVAEDNVSTGKCDTWCLKQCKTSCAGDYACGQQCKISCECKA